MLCVSDAFGCAIVTPNIHTLSPSLIGTSFGPLQPGNSYYNEVFCGRLKGSLFLEVNHMSLMVDVTAEQPRLPDRLAVQNCAAEEIASPWRTN
jgi:hypothetical protein